MEARRSEKIIRLFFGKHFSKDVQFRFRFWFCSAIEKDEKVEVLNDIWQTCPSTATDQTWKDLEQMHNRMRIHARRKPWYRQVPLRYAAMLALVLGTAFSMRVISFQEAKIESPEMTELYVSYGECKQVVLADSSVIWVNAGSLLIYPKEFTASATRKIYLSGEACFQVAKNPDKPFIVSTNHLDVQALGTRFSVRAYPSSVITSSTLEEGSVKVDVKSSNPFSSILVPGEQLAYDRHSGKISINRVDAEQMSAWKEGYLIFENASFAQLAAALERKYNVTINYNAKKYEDGSYCVKFAPDESIEDALKILSHLIDKFNYIVSGRTISIN